jgi:hypothetical protein
MNSASDEALGGRYPRGLIVQQQRYRPSDSNTNIDIKFRNQDYH